MSEIPTKMSPVISDCFMACDDGTSLHVDSHAGGGHPKADAFRPLPACVTITHRDKHGVEITQRYEPVPGTREKGPPRPIDVRLTSDPEPRR